MAAATARTVAMHSCAAVLSLAAMLAAAARGSDEHAQPTREICPGHPKGSPCPLPPGCARLRATDTDPEMRWWCQSPTKQPTVYRHYTDCTNEHVVCTPRQRTAGSSAAPPPPVREQLVVFYPGTGLVPQDYSEIVSDFAGHGFHSIGLMYPSTQGQADCAMSRVANPTDLNCTARERLRVLTGATESYGAAETHTNITTPDSIVNRLSKALLRLGPPWSGWLRADGSLDWSNIIVSGHSNGADHSGFTAKTFNVSRALMFSGANDMVGPKPKGHQCVPAAGS